MMDKRTYVCLVVSIILKAVSLQTKDYIPAMNSTPRTERLTVSSTEADNITILQNGSASLSTFTTTVNITNFPTLLQSTHSPHTETSAITAEAKTEMTFPTESFSTNSTHQATVVDFNVTTSATTLKPTVQPSKTAPLISSNSVSAIQFPAEGSGLSNSDTILTIFFAIVLALTILGFIIYIFNKYRKRRDQFSHHPLYDASFETVDRYATPDDTLVISGGLYDAPRISNSNMTVYDDDELQIDQLPFSAQPGQYRLEFLPGEKEVDFSSTYEGTFQIPPGGI
ncbi:uncharacterized protein LOC118089406 isoform X2 [Zootoca vivipara]|nr:uncharacterized protein LOC118089406 isoform X2 [Zootoca vivipara]XP_034979931.1 uncharacterized protein LOC118089406 isoform X2 [Zootoca vivipara]XP_034979932.1 uncharacterized protein LOC118089406 [Zootoca vivipara]